jgi:hypothetical protein
MQLAERALEHRPVEKEQGVQCLVLRARRDAAIDGQVRQERCYLAFSHIARMAAVVKANEANDPVDVGLLRAHAEMTHADGVPHQ